MRETRWPQTSILKQNLWRERNVYHKFQFLDRPCAEEKKNYHKFQYLGRELERDDVDHDNWIITVVSLFRQNLWWERPFSHNSFTIWIDMLSKKHISLQFHCDIQIGLVMKHVYHNNFTIWMVLVMRETCLSQQFHYLDWTHGEWDTFVTIVSLFKWYVLAMRETCLSQQFHYLDRTCDGWDMFVTVVSLLNDTCDERDTFITVVSQIYTDCLTRVPTGVPAPDFGCGLPHLLLLV